MDYSTAKALLLSHGLGQRDSECDTPACPGFLEMLRPYKGLKENNFHKVLQAVFVVGDCFHKERDIDRELVNTLWAICRTSRAWGLHPKGMLQRNRLITQEDTELLEVWVDTIESSIGRLLNGCAPYLCVHRYAEYVVTRNAWTNIHFFVPLMMQFLEDQDPTLDPTVVADALGCIGEAARPALPSLRAATQRVFADWCNEEAQFAIKNAISRIELG